MRSSRFGYARGEVAYTRMDIPTPAPNGTVVTFTLAGTPITGTETVFLNGVAQDPDVDYTISGGEIGISPPLESTDQLGVSYFYGSYTGYHRMETPSPPTDGSTTVFTLSLTPVSGSVICYLNGIVQDPGEDFEFSQTANVIIVHSRVIALLTVERRHAHSMRSITSLTGLPDDTSPRIFTIWASLNLELFKFRSP